MSGVELTAHTKSVIRFEQSTPIARLMIKCKLLNSISNVLYSARLCRKSII